MPGESAGRGTPQGVCPRPGASLNPEPSSPATAPPAHTPCSAGWSQQELLQARSLTHPSGGPRAPSQPTSGNPVPPQPRFALCDVGTTLHALHSLCPTAALSTQHPGCLSTQAGSPRRLEHTHGGSQRRRAERREGMAAERAEGSPQGLLWLPGPGGRQRGARVPVAGRAGWAAPRGPRHRVCLPQGRPRRGCVLTLLRRHECLPLASSLTTILGAACQAGAGRRGPQEGSCSCGEHGGAAASSHSPCAHAPAGLCSVGGVGAVSLQEHGPEPPAAGAAPLATGPPSRRRCGHRRCSDLNVYTRPVTPVFLACVCACAHAFHTGTHRCRHTHWMS